MRTLVLILIGLVVIGVAMWSSPPARRALVAWLFTAVWLGVVAWNLRGGLLHGYSLREELPIQLLIFALPVAVGWWLVWKSPR